ncbi:MAG TPA: P-loop NTPase, partial [Anaeromyxobacteraceae bacterium]|nr:P-loop NTPase [Anaeromyxobacteraceae bacterium]
MAKNIFIVGGGKGGVGKSIVAMTLADYLLEKGEEVLLIESDTSNPDVAKAYRDRTATAIVNLDEADGWIELVNLCEKHSNSAVVINTAARNHDGVANYGMTLSSTLADLKRRAVALWLINRQRDSLELLNKFLDALPNCELHVVRNSFFGDEWKFELYNASKAKATVEARGGKTLTFP